MKNPPLGFIKESPASSKILHKISLLFWYIETLTFANAHFATILWAKAGAFTKPRIRLHKIRAFKSKSFASISGWTAIKPILSPAKDSSLEKLYAIILFL